MAVKHRDPPYTADTPIESTDTRMTKFMKWSKPLRPAYLAARTKGEVLGSLLVVENRFGSSEGTRRPTKKSPRI